MSFIKGSSLKIILSLAIACLSSFSAFCQNIVDTSAKPQAFAPGIVTTPYTEWATSFTPDGKTVYFSRGAIYWTMCYSKLVDGKWTKPKVVNISGKWTDTDPFITPDGRKMFFISNRPLEGASQDKQIRAVVAQMRADRKIEINEELLNSVLPSQGNTRRS